ncbi:conserved hypothetical protein [Vibrio nigripulchritudo MADA3029]|uniref:YdcF family protein n=1 Tax=Vibrio nigripulchritudo TaxID=28173 RepID=UPI0003B208CA|nr:YdcF family protein [Vibrio nigripulchritudo]CCN46865.1 conserved hypothetical protein [Vibrio nigripulchritudo MADA3020]CCN51207.1 conserved hypothetical protein [Vibrio nigripulchritudo MADA3021]CCN56778.1 conserved hypothetical protein [Vibrio nigripulchritudo MADA3029]
MHQILIVVLGKRLVDNRLTLESKSRVDAAIEFLKSLSPDSYSNVVLGFCGGVTPGNTASEAAEMHQYFNQVAKEKPFCLPDDILIENQSTSTVENISMLAKVLVDRKVYNSGSQVRLVLVSNDYHLERIFEIQKLIDEQGLLGVLKKRCEASGIHLTIPYDLTQHVTPPYPYNSVESQLFLSIEKLTTYRVFLEGVYCGAILRPVEQVRETPLQLAKEALNTARALLTSELENAHLVSSVLDLIEQCIAKTEKSLDSVTIREALGVLDVNLSMLNRMLDPELAEFDRWWKC